jgi:uncharacterized protein DUF4258
MRLTRHAKNRLRHLHGTIEDVERVIEQPLAADKDPDGRPRYRGFIRGTPVKVVVAVDEPDLIVTIHKRRK